MVFRRRGSICCCLVLAAVSCALQRRNDQAAAPKLKDITPAVRSKIDAIAVSAARPVTPAREAELYGDVLGWLLAQTPLPAAEERDRATAAHNDLIKKSTVLPTPAKAQVVLDRLVGEIPAAMRPTPYKFQLTVIDAPSARTWALGGGYIYITRACLEAILSDTTRAPDLLAFALGIELGHTCLSHCRRGYQLVKIRDELKSSASQGVNPQALAQALETSVTVTGNAVQMSFSPGQTYASDLFALHLCRNSGFDLEHALDLLRGWAAAKDPSLVNGDSKPTAPTGGTLAPTDLERLGQLKAEREGTPPPGLYGLFTFDGSSGTLTPAESNSVSSSTSAVVFVHGMDSDLQTWRTMISTLAERPSAEHVMILGFQYPNDGSLARAGIYLKREMDRVCGASSQVDFICHSAGGLVFRYYAGVMGGNFRQTVFEGSPHAGSQFASLRPLLEAQRFVGDLQLGYPAALQKVITDGRGQIGRDLAPDSLFLRYLNRASVPVDRCAIVRGRAIDPAQAAVLALGLSAAKDGMRRSLAGASNAGTLQLTAANSLDTFELPAEISAGDFAVSLESAALPGVEIVHTVSLNHVQLPGAPEVIDLVLSHLYP